MSSRSLPTRASSSSAWRSRTSTASRASVPRLPSGRRTACAIRDRRSARSPRFTTTCACSLRASAGPICRQCGQEVVRETAEVVATRLLTLPEGTRVVLGYDMPLITDAAGNGASADVVEPAEAGAESADLFEAGDAREGGLFGDATGAAGADVAIRSALDTLRRKGFGRLLVDGQPVILDDVDVSALRSETVLRVVVDRLKIEGELRARLTDSIETAYHEGGGAAWAVELPSSDGGIAVTHSFSERFECRRCHITYEDPQPRLFSFNNPFGACPTCHGFGNIIELDMDLVVPDASKSIAQGAIEPWSEAALPVSPRRAQTRREDARLAARGALARPVGRRPAIRRRRRWRRLRGHPRLLSRGSNGRSTRFTCACFCRDIAAISPAPTAAGRGCGARRVTCASAT